MPQLNIPEGYQQVMPYLIVQGATGFQAFVQNVFGATEKQKHMRDENTVMHAEVKIGDSTIMFADSTAQWPPQMAGLFIYVPDADETYKKALGEGATIVMELADMDYGRSCGVKDPFGNVWWITSVKK